MSGHSKWSTIKRKKGAADAKRGVVFTRLSKDITAASRASGGNPDMNPTLRLAIKKAKAANMPVTNIDRAVKKGTGDLPGVKYEDIIYECYGPSGVAILLEVLTDNKNRTVSEIKNILTKNGGNLGEAGCVNWMFIKKGIITIDNSLIDEDKVLEILEYDIEDLIQDEMCYTISILPENFDKVSKSIEDNGIEIDGEISLIASNIVKVTKDQSTAIVSLLEQLDEHDDIQKVHTNFEIE
jgi:YebC/PmpR family DNA-binding regulatory protein